MMWKHLSVRSETSSDVRPLVSIGGRISTLILPGKREPVRNPRTTRALFSALPGPLLHLPWRAQAQPSSLTGLWASIPREQVGAALVSGVRDCSGDWTLPLNSCPKQQSISFVPQTDIPARGYPLAKSRQSPGVWTHSAPGPCQAQPAPGAPSICFSPTLLPLAGSSHPGREHSKHGFLPKMRVTAPS